MRAGCRPSDRRRVLDREGVPLLVVGVADRLAVVLATHALEATGIAWDESTTGILSVLVFGAGTDYALLLISRYRDELRRHESRYVAMRAAVRGTVEPVLASSTTVVLGLLTLLLSVIPTTRGLGLGDARLPGLVTDEPVEALGLQGEKVGNGQRVADLGEREPR